MAWMYVWACFVTGLPNYRHCCRLEVDAPAVSREETARWTGSKCKRNQSPAHARRLFEEGATSPVSKMTMAVRRVDLHGQAELSFGQPR